MFSFLLFLANANLLFSCFRRIKARGTESGQQAEDITLERGQEKRQKEGGGKTTKNDGEGYLTPIDVNSSGILPQHLNEHESQIYDDIM